MDFFKVLFFEKIGATVAYSGKDWEALFAASVGGYPIATITGSPPLYFIADGSNLTDYTISGNTVQNGTPTPEAPVDVVGCGERTGNLFDASMTFEKGYITIKGNVEVANSMVHTKDYIPIKNSSQYVFTGKLVPPVIRASVAMYDAQKNFIIRIAGDLGENTLFFTTTGNCSYVRFSVNDGYDNFHYDPNTIMLNEGSTAIPYEPYGYKLPITCGGETKNIYLGQVETTRRIKKVVLTGNEAVFYGAEYTRFRVGIADFETFGVRATPFYMSHYIVVSDGRALPDVPDNAAYSGSLSDNHHIFIKTTDYTSAEDFKAFLADQYAAGTPVTVWYVIAEPETGIVNGPLMKIGDYADTITMAQAGETIPTIAGSNTLSVGTTLQPSSVSITGHIKPTTP